MCSISTYFHMILNFWLDSLYCVGGKRRLEPLRDLVLDNLSCISHPLGVINFPVLSQHLKIFTLEFLVMSLA